MSDENKIKGLVMYGAGWCPDVFLAKRFLARREIGYEYKDIDTAEFKAELLELRGKEWVVPTFVLPSGEVLDNPSMRDLADKLGLPKRRRKG